MGADTVFNPLGNDISESELTEDAVSVEKIKASDKGLYDNFVGSAEDTQVWDVTESTGTSDITANQLRISTTATANKYAYVRSDAGWTGKTTMTIIFSKLMNINPPGDNTYSGADITKSCGFTDGANDYAFLGKNDSASGWAICSKDGTTASRGTTVTIDFSSIKEIKLVITFGTDIKLYVDGVLADTKTTNLPRSAQTLKAQLGDMSGGAGGVAYISYYDFVKVIIL